jgi:hypothetical protein
VMITLPPSYPCYWELITAHLLPCLNYMLGRVAFFLDSWHLKMGLIYCPELSVRNYHYVLLISPEDFSSHLGTTLTNRNNMHDKLIGLNMGTAYYHMVLVKVKVSLYTPWMHTRGVQVQFHLFLISALDGGEWSASHSHHFTLGEKASFTWTGVVFLFAI